MLSIAPVDGRSPCDSDYIEQLNGSLLLFIRVFYPLLTGNEFKVSHPQGRESLHITLTTELEDLVLNPGKNKLINIEPGAGKSTMVSFFTAWSLSMYAYSQYLYVSFSKELATKHTTVVRNIIQLPEYQYMYGIKIKNDVRGKGYFETIQNGTNHQGTIAAAGSAGTVTGLNAGRPQMSEFSGALIMDDLHKPDEVHSDTLRSKVINNYKETLMQRCRGISVPSIYIGQRLHEADICEFIKDGGDGKQWDKIILPSIDEVGNVLYPEKNSKEYLLTLKEKNAYTFYSQYQQNPQPAGGSLFKEDMFYILDDDPKPIATFITVDTAESSREHADYTVFSFWGLYEIEFAGKKTGEMGLHWINCVQQRVEPKDLMTEFMSFYHGCMLYPVVPTVAALEKKSTGVTLLSVLSDLRGINIRDIDRTRASGNKTTRFLSMQPYISSKQISFTRYAKHAHMCIQHMCKITANDTHAHDDICDTAYDAIKIALMDKTLYNNNNNSIQQNIELGSKLKYQSTLASRMYNYDPKNY